MRLLRKPPVSSSMSREPDPAQARPPAREAAKLVDVVEFVDGQFTVTLKDRDWYRAGNCAARAR